MTATADTYQPGDVLDFWFAAGPEKWFSRNDAFDADIHARFAPAVAAAGSGALDALAATANGALCLVILLDQFTRNINRNSAGMYDNDAKALDIANAAIDKGFDVELPSLARRWFYMPFMHSESLADQRRSVALNALVEDESCLKYAIHHAGIIDKFGRFPHRNAILNRVSTPAELAFIAKGGFSG